MNCSENSTCRSPQIPGKEFIFIPNNERYSPAEERISNKWNQFFMNSSGSETDIESNDSGQSTEPSYASSICSLTSYDEPNYDYVAEQTLNTENNPAVTDISLVPDCLKRKSDGLCQITLSANSSAYQHFRKAYPKPRLDQPNGMELSRLDENENNSVNLPRQPHSLRSRVNVQDFDRLENLKISNGDNGMLKSVKGTVRGYKNMVRRYSASFNSKGHVIPPSEQCTNEEDMQRIIIYTTSMTAVRATTDACSYVKKVFQNRGVTFEERDVFIHKEHQREMQKQLGKGLTLPQVIINGIHIGSAAEIEELNETGKLTTLLAKFERCFGAKECGRCGGRRFINCLICGGSKTSRKHRLIREICSLKCTTCNENGLVVCPECMAEPAKD